MQRVCIPVSMQTGSTWHLRSAFFVLARKHSRRTVAPHFAVRACAFCIQEEFIQRSERAHPACYLPNLHARAPHRTPRRARIGSVCPKFSYIKCMAWVPPQQTNDDV
eukprot:6196220-Pleurochrysis_carterae.AAC.2